MTVRGLHEHCIAAEVIGSTNTILYPQHSVMSVRSYRSLQTMLKTISDYNRVSYDNQ